MSDAKSRPLTEDERPGIERVLEEHRARYELTGDSFEIWNAYHLCRSVERSGADLPLPEWVLGEFDKIVDRFHSAQRARIRYPGGPTDDRHWKTIVVEAFGFPTRKGQATDPFERSSRHDVGIDLAIRVRLLVHGNGYKESNAIMIVSGEQGVSEPTVRRAWIRFASVVRREELPTQRDSMEVLDRQLREANEIECRHVEKSSPRTR